MNKHIKIAIAGAAIVALAMGLLVGLASKEKEEDLTQRTSAASASTGYVVSTGYTAYEGKSGKGSKGSE
jgi:hypothetical protein